MDSVRERVMNTKITKEERNWILYDVGNSAFIMLVTTIIPIYFNYLAGNAGLSDVEYLAYWGYAASFATLVVAILGPICGSIADTKGFKKPIFIISLAVGAGCCIGMGFAKSWLAFLIIFFVAKVGYSGSLIFYDSMLPDITCEDKMDRVSSLGYAYGYIGSCIPFIVCLVIVLGADKLGITMSAAMAISFAITAAWWMAVTIPLIKTYKQKHYVEREKGAIKKSFIRIGQTFKNIKKEKKAFFFLLAFFFYIDGVYTIIDMATAYGSALGLDSTGLLLALLVTQIVAFPCALIYGRLSKKVGRCREVDHGMYSGLYRYCTFCDHSSDTASVLGACGPCWNVPGWNPGIVKILLYQDNSRQSVRRILRTL